MNDVDLGPKSGALLFNSLKDQNSIILAANPRITLVSKGIFQAAKDMDAALIVEIARSECDLEGGYTGLDPAEFSRRTNETAREVGFDIWALHADHIGIKKGTPEDIEGTRELVSGQIDAGFTSFAIDASHLFNFQGGDLMGKIANNIDLYTKIIIPNA